MAVLLQDEAAPVTLGPQNFADGLVTGQSTRVGWSRYDAHGQLQTSFAFRINPQGISRVEAARNQLFATKGGFYVDQFGPGASSISLRMLVASGRDSAGDTFFTQRDDVLLWLANIYDPATQQGFTGKVYFHDNHLRQNHRERVYFPEQAVNVQRSVDQHGVWLVEVQMVGLEQHPLSDVVTKPHHRPQPKHNYVLYKVRAGDTFARIVARRVKANPTKANRHRVVHFIVEHNAWLTRARSDVIDGTLYPRKPMVVYPGEVLKLPRS